MANLNDYQLVRVSEDERAGLAYKAKQPRDEPEGTFYCPLAYQRVMRFLCSLWAIVLCNAPVAIL